MSEATLEKAICSKCNEPIRDNTVFCYNCGNRTAVAGTESASPVNDTDPDVDARTKAALDDMVERFRIDETADDKIAKAAAERRRARGSQRKPSGTVWEPRDASFSVLVLIVAIIVTFVTAVIVLLTVFWK